MKDKKIKSRFLEQEKKEKREKLPEGIDKEDYILLTRDQCAKLAGVHKNTIIAWNNSGFLKCEKKGRIVRIKLTEFTKALGKSEGAEAVEDFKKKYNDLRNSFGLVDQVELPDEWLEKKEDKNRIKIQDLYFPNENPNEA